MRPALAAVSLVLCAFFAVGCGGASLQSIAHKQAKYYGSPHAGIKRVEKVQILGGGKSPWAIILMRGRSPFRLPCAGGPNPIAGIVGIGIGVRCQPHYAAFGVKPGDQTARLSWGLSSSQISAIAAARRMQRRFRIFPDLTSMNVRCSIPRRTGGAVMGTCATEAGPPNHVRRVAFMEIWPPRWKPAGWVVTLTRDGRVQSIHITGQPPQLQK